MAIDPNADAYSTLWEQALAPLVTGQHFDDNGVAVNVSGDDPSLPQMDPTGALTIPTDDGGVLIQFGSGTDEQQAQDFDGYHYENLAILISDSTRGQVADDLIQGVEQDDRDRAQWLNNRAKGIDLLALAMEAPRTDASSSSGSMEGMSSIRNPLL